MAWGLAVGPSFLSFPRSKAVFMRNASRGAEFKPIKLKPLIVGLDVIEPETDLDLRLAWFEYQRALAQLHRTWSQMRRHALAPQPKITHG